MQLLQMEELNRPYNDDNGDDNNNNVDQTPKNLFLNEQKEINSVIPLYLINKYRIIR